MTLEAPSRQRWDRFEQRWKILAQLRMECYITPCVVGMDVFMYVCIYVCLHVCVHVRNYVSMFVCVFV